MRQKHILVIQLNQYYQQYGRQKQDVIYRRTILSELKKRDQDFPLDDHDAILDDVLRFLVWSFLVVIVATWLWRQYYKHAGDPCSKLPLPPGSMGFPLVGETLSLITKGSDYYLSRREQYGHVYKTHLLGQPTIRIIGADNVRHMLMGEHTTVESSYPKSLKRLLGPGGLLSATPESHRIRKKLLLKALAPAALHGHVQSIQKLVRRHILDWCNKGEQLGTDICKRLAMSVAANILIGFDVDDQKLQSIINSFKTFTGNLFSLPWELPGSGLSKGLKARKQLIKEIKKRLQTETPHWSLVDELKTLDETTASLTADEMADAILELWFAGNDTSSSTSNSTLLALGKDDGVRKRIEEELAENGLLNSEDELTFDSLKKLTYVDHVVKEVLRVYPPVGGGFRRVKKTMEIEGFQIPEGWSVIYSIRDTHQTSKLFEDREEFQPERWDEMDKKTRLSGKRFHYIPFGAGARACPGENFARMFVKIFIVELIKTCKWELKNKNPKISYFPVTKPSDDLPVTFHLREDKTKSVDFLESRDIFPHNTYRRLIPRFQL
ncbi:cytochrome P450 26B1-like isoform X1 [Haliotis rufescens]|uniref:cytochrome P450 26B1-like isoform X1 n=1 Tax=Haliotis rufescens TaxID=6454 RepID=UPI00201EA824|nr:cytochrome P450 26B1-like isoform X1 [Haliotis rufescens]XP_046362370.2 cytochrome P450 26B1-like isoform X1 [Haliotis rufescens]